MRTPRLTLAFALCAGAAAPVALPGAACAGEGPRAALVIDTGGAVTTYCVALPEASVSGIDLVELAGEQHGLDYSLGFGGEAVCRLEDVGPEGDDCFGEYPEFWGYWHGDGSGGWQWAGTGAGSASIEDGDVDGWSWGDGDNGSTHQAPPPTELGDVCAATTAPAPPKAGETKERGSGAEDLTVTGSPPAGGDAGAPAPTTEDARDGRRPRAAPEGGTQDVTEPAAPATAAPSPAATALASRPASEENEGGPPLTGVVGLVAAGALGVAAWWSSRRRKAA